MAPVSYESFLQNKMQLGTNDGFEPLWIPDFLFDFQKDLVSWAIQKGRAAIFADCGLGKTPMQLVWAENIVRKTNKRILILTPIAVGLQTVSEGKKFSIECERSRDGKLPKSKIVITNYEQLSKFDPNDFIGVICDESSILKHFSGTTQKEVTRFMSKIPYRLLCTATAAPNDYIELGTSSEALGELGYSDMLFRFFKQNDKAKWRQDEVRLARFSNPNDPILVANGKELGGNYYQKLAYRIAQQIGQWRLKAHAEVPFWRWVASWARACRKPEDLGYENDGFKLPPLQENYHIVRAKSPPDGMLFTLPAFGLGEEREERRRTLNERCEMVAHLVFHKDPAIAWCHLNSEGNKLEKLIDDSVQVSGADDDEAKEEKINAFLCGQARVLVTKAKIAGFGLNLQKCANVVTFVTHSYESYYQSVRRCWRFGQKKPVTVDIVATEGEQRVSQNMARKAEAAAVMFDNLVKYMNESTILKKSYHPIKTEVPSWL